MQSVTENDSLIGHMLLGKSSWSIYR